MPGAFDYFVVLAEMRTGSNFLEANLNLFADLECHGEAFNPHFIGYPKASEILGVTQAMRDADPKRLIDTIKNSSKGLGGFRFFNDHDHRALEICLRDRRCAKIILTRNPLDSYVSWKIAQATGQWKLTNVKRRKDSTIRFDPAEFDAYIARLQAFQITVLNDMQASGQTAFHLSYDDLHNLETLNGLARFLGSVETLGKLDGSLKKQNPSSLRDKVSNYDEMSQALAKTDYFDLSRTPNFEPRRGAAVPGYIAGAQAPLLYMPVRSGPERAVTDWLARLDGAGLGDLQTMTNQKTLRQWKRRMGLHRSFTVVRHPVARAHAAFCDKILGTEDGAFDEIRKTLRNFHKLPIPSDGLDEGYDRRAHRQAFVAFLEFLRANLAGQTSLRIDANWASQSSVVQGMARFALPDAILREEEIKQMLPQMAAQFGYDPAPAVPEVDPDRPFALAEIYDAEIERLTKAAYQRDYMMFGFGPWQ